MKNKFPLLQEVSFLFNIQEHGDVFFFILDSLILRLIVIQGLTN